MITRYVAVPTCDGGSYHFPASAPVSSPKIIEHSHKATPSASTLTPPRSCTVPNHSRPFSVVSAFTDFELCAVAELLSPAVSHARSVAEEQEATGVALDDDDYIDASIKPCEKRQRKTSITPHLLLECEEPFSPLHPSYSPASCTFTPSESEYESYPEDNHWHPHTPSHSAYPPAFHLPRRVRARKQSSTGVSTSDSDTPSLSSSVTSVSSSYSQSCSPPRSPATLKTPVDHTPSQLTLAIIEERSAENGSQSSGSIVFAPTERSLGDAKSLRTLEIRPKNRNVENLRVHVPPLSVPFPVLTHSPSPTIDSTLPVSTNRMVRPGLKSLTRIISPGSKTSKSFESGSELSMSPTMSLATSRFSKDDAKEEKTRRAEEKTRKAEAKRMKKAEQKDKVERLAEELKERKRRQALARERGSVHSQRSGGRTGHGPWDTHIAMYDGLGSAM